MSALMVSFRTVATGLAIGSVVVLGAAGCSSGSSSSEVTATATVTETASASPSGSPSASSASASPTSQSTTPPPNGASQLESRSSNGVQYTRYSISGQQPAQVVSYYTNAWQGEGYTIDSSGGGGGGWGQYGGSGAGATASKSGSFLAVQAGGESGSTTYFEVCEGTDKQAVDDCGDDNDNDNDN